VQTALTDASGPGNADMATSMQTTVYNVGIAAGSLAGGLILQHAGAGALPWATSALSAAALATAAAARRLAFPADHTRRGYFPRSLDPRSPHRLPNAKPAGH
jgi:predicted MFS family arabinose efflux permease